MAGSSQSTPHLRKVIEGLTHDIRNYVHVISGAVETLRVTGSLPLELPQLFNPIEEINRLLAELKEYFFPPNSQLSAANAVFL